MICFFVSDLHGSEERYKKFFTAIEKERPEAIFMGGDLLPSGIASMMSSINPSHRDFINDFLAREFSRVKDILKDEYPAVFLILGNDDGRFYEASVMDIATGGLWKYVHMRKISFRDLNIYGYSYVPPTPFRLKDWERYDVSRYAEPGCLSPEEGIHSITVSEYEKKYSTIQKDLNNLAGEDNLEKAIFLFHSPPYNTVLDRAALDGKMIDYVPVDTHIGSIAIKNFIEEKQPLITLHGHVHESARITGAWKEKIGNTSSFTAAHDGPELSLIRLDPKNPDRTTRELL
ncbi:MAG: metallophosphoesterase [Candidatus Eremiobacterota bacterium]